MAIDLTPTLAALYAELVTLQVATNGSNATAAQRERLRAVKLEIVAAGGQPIPA